MPRALPYRLNPPDTLEAKPCCKVGPHTVLEPESSSSYQAPTLARTGTSAVNISFNPNIKDTK